MPTSSTKAATRDPNGPPRDNTVAYTKLNVFRRQRVNCHTRQDSFILNCIYLKASYYMMSIDLSFSEGLVKLKAFGSRHWLKKGVAEWLRYFV